MRLSFAYLVGLAGLVAGHSKHVFKYEVDAYYNSPNSISDADSRIPMLYDPIGKEVVRIIPANQVVPHHNQVSSNYNYLQRFCAKNLDKKETEYLGPANKTIIDAAFIIAPLYEANDSSTLGHVPPRHGASRRESSSSTSSTSGSSTSSAQNNEIPSGFLRPKAKEEEAHRKSSSTDSSCTSSTSPSCTSSTSTSCTSSTSTSCTSSSCTEYSRLVTATEDEMILRDYPCLQKKCMYPAEGSIIKSLTSTCGNTYLLNSTALVVLNERCCEKKEVLLDYAEPATDFILDQVNEFIFVGFVGQFIQVRCMKSLKLIYAGFIDGPILDPSEFRLENSAQNNGRNVAWFNLLETSRSFTVAFCFEEFSHCSKSSHSCSSSSSSSCSSSSFGCGCSSPFRKILHAPLKSALEGSLTEKGGSEPCFPSAAEEIVVFNDPVNHVDIFIGMNPRVKGGSCEHTELHIYTFKISKHFNIIAECQDLSLPCKVDGVVSTSYGARNDNNDLFISFTPSLDMVKLHYHARGHVRESTL